MARMESATDEGKTARWVVATNADSEAIATETRPTETNAELSQAEPRPDLVWDGQTRGLCVRVYGDRFQIIHRRLSH